ncbi:MAG: hypothetical protein IPG68_01175 [Micrococcales bacterium]|nr:hypothetical protein [Micrococcales bacterium]
MKKVDGGASVPADWKLSAIAAAPNAGKNIVDRAGNITTLAEVYAGTEYTLSEDGPGNYTASNWVCTGTGVTQNGNKVTVAKNGEVTCEITNTRDLAKLAVVKKVDGGASVPADWKPRPSPQPQRRQEHRRPGRQHHHPGRGLRRHRVHPVRVRAGQLHRQQLGLHRHRCHPERQQGHRRQERRGHL